MWVPLLPEPPAKGWWTELQAAELVAWAGRADQDVRARRAARDERVAQAERVRLGERMRVCRESGHRSCGAVSNQPICVHPALPRLGRQERWDRAFAEGGSAWADYVANGGY